MAQTDYKFQGWMGLDPSSGQGNMVWQEFEPKEWEETDVDIKISHCGICGSDLHTLRSGWVSSIWANFDPAEPRAEEGVTDYFYLALIRDPPCILAASATRSWA